MPCQTLRSGVESKGKWVYGDWAKLLRLVAHAMYIYGKACGVPGRDHEIFHEDVETNDFARTGDGTG